MLTVGVTPSLLAGIISLRFFPWGGRNPPVLLEVYMRRKRMSRRGSRKLFSRTAGRSHKRNRIRIMRGGLRI